MKILLIGGTGNLSLDAAEAFVREGYDVSVLTRGNIPVLEGCEALCADRDDRVAMEAALGGREFDSVVNFLGFMRGQCELDYQLLRGRIGQYLFISSATVYEKPHRALPITEDMAQSNIFSDYARKKIECEAYLREVEGGDFPLTIVRPSHTFSRSWIPSPLHGSADFTIAARIEAGKPIIVHGDGQSLWTLTAASDFARALAGLVGNAEALGEAFHITSDEVLSWNEIYQEIGMALGREPQVVHIPVDFLCRVDASAEAKLLGDKAENAVFDNRKIKRFLPDFACAKTFRQALRESVAWYRENPARQKVNPEVDQLIEKTIEEWGKGALV